MSAIRILLVLVLLVFASPVQAQQGKRYALLVGVTEYDHSTFSTLKYTENDAAVTARVLKEAGYDEVILLTTAEGKKSEKSAPTAANIRAALKRLSNKVKGNDLLLVGLAGHGMLWPVLDEKTKKERDESFFCPQDARPRSKRSLAELEKTMIPLGELFLALDESGAGVRLLLVDACRNEVKGNTRSIDFDTLPRTKKGTAVLFSCKAGQQAFETEKLKHGVFFHHVIEGLKGKAEDSDGEITWSSLSDYVIKRVTRDVPRIISEGAKQTPHEMRNIEGISPLLLPLAKKGSDANAMFDLGRKHEHGRGVPQDYRKAFEWYTKAAGKGHATAMNNLGVLYQNGRGVDQDDEKAVELFRKAADKGQAMAMHNLGWMYQNGRGVDKDEKKALEWFTKAAAKDNTLALSRLGWMYANGRGVDKDEKKAFEWYSKAAGKGDESAMNWLGWMYQNGLGVDRDDKQAVEWYVKAAAKGQVFAMNQLGVMYQNGRGVTKDDAKAVEWYSKAADKGNENAMYNLGAMYANGRGVDKDDEKAVEWYSKAADKGQLDAMNNLGLMYENGRGVSKDDKKAIEWYTKAADKGHVTAMANLADNYEFGKGVTKDEKKALELYTKAAANHNTFALYRLGKMYENGKGVTQDIPTALKWYRKAAALGEPNAKKAVERLDSNA